MQSPIAVSWAYGTTTRNFATGWMIMRYPIDDQVIHLSLRNGRIVLRAYDGGRTSGAVRDQKNARLGFIAPPQLSLIG